MYGNGLRQASCYTKLQTIFAGTREKKFSLVRVNKETTLRRRIIEETRVIMLTTHSALNVGKSIQESVEWEQMLATFVARKDILREVVL